jgi:hypothetical protein
MIDSNPLMPGSQRHGSRLRRASLRWMCLLVGVPVLTALDRGYPINLTASAMPY